MQIVIEISERDYELMKAHVCKSSSDFIILNGTPLETVLNKIRAEIEKPLRDERCFDTAEAKAQYIALNWCIEIIDKYKAESEEV